MTARAGTSSGSAPARPAPRLRGFAAVLGALGLATLGGVVAGNGNPLFAVLPVLGFLACYAVVKLPVRVPALALFFVGLLVDNPPEPFADGQYKSPVYVVGELLLTQLKSVIPIGALVMSGTDLVILCLSILYFVRRVMGSKIDRRDAVPAPRPLVLACIACVVAALVMWGWGLSRGGAFRFTLWQARNMVLLPLFTLFFLAAFPNAESYRTLGRVVFVAGCIKALISVLLHLEFPTASYSTSHYDSMLFAICTCMIVIWFTQQPSWRRLLRGVLPFGLLVLGMLANHRRLVYAQVGDALLLLFFLTPWSRRKKRLARAVLLSIPVGAIYLAVGWNSPTGIFKPVGTFRSMADSKSDASSLWRDMENFNLISTLTEHPIAGTGLGHPYEHTVPIDEIPGYELEPYVPHNSMLGIWAYTGYVGFSMIWMVLSVGAYFAVRAYRFAKQPMDRTAALSVVSMILIYVLHCYGDLGLGTYVSLFLVPPALAIAGKLAIAVGAWPQSRRAPVARVSVSQAPPLVLPRGFES